MLFANRTCYAWQNWAAENLLKEINELERVAKLFRNHLDYAAPDAFGEIVKNMMDSRSFPVIKDNWKRRWIMKVSDFLGTTHMGKGFLCHFLSLKLTY